LYGAGIDGTLQLEVPDITVKALELRKQQNYEYPQGIDFIFVTADGELFNIPRLVMNKEEQ
jgi:alpha-D-ribose 1-methylphosphonate 5-triphosphate synthase subunit PhnH